MFWSCLTELDLCLGIVLMILYGLFTLRNQHVSLTDVSFFCRCWPLLVYMSYSAATATSDYSVSDLLSLPHQQSFSNFVEVPSGPDQSCFAGFGLAISSFDFYLCLLFVFIIPAFVNFESILLLMFAYVAQLFMIHSTDFVSFYICLEAQNFCFLVLCGLQSIGSLAQTNKLTPQMSGGFNVEASLKFLLLSAFSSGVLLFWFSTLYLRTGTSAFVAYNAIGTGYESWQLLAALMFKLGAAPLHLWVVDIYSGVKRQLLLYVSTAPKYSIFCFWVNSLQQVWTEYSIYAFVAFSLVLGSIGAYSQPVLRSLFAYSTINEIGLLCLAVETAGFHTLFQHLGIYIVSQLLLWNMYDKRFFNMLAVSLAGLPPFAGFFGKAWVLWSATYSGAYSLLAVALTCTALSLVYYLRVIRLYWNTPTTTLRVSQYNNMRSNSLSIASTLNCNVANTSNRILLTSACVVFLIFSPIFFIKPFVL